MTNVLLIVEDEADMRRMIRALLGRDERLEIHGEASSASQAIELARRHQPALIIVDHLIDGPMTGLDAAPLIKAVAPNTKILLFSAYDLRREATGSNGVDAFVRKDQPGRLLPAAQRLLDLSPLAA